MHNFANYMTFPTLEGWWLFPGGRSGSSAQRSQLCSALSWGLAMASSGCHLGALFYRPVSSASGRLPPPLVSFVFKVSLSMCLQLYLLELLPMSLTKIISSKCLPKSLIMWFSLSLEQNPISCESESSIKILISLCRAVMFCLIID